MTEDDKLILASEARTLLASDLLNEIFSVIERKALSDLLDTDPAHEHERTALIERIRASRLVKQELTSKVLDGKEIEYRRANDLGD